jgi:Tfp pilus assembly protein PilF
MTRKEQIEKLLAESPEDSFLRYGLAMEHTGAGNDTAAIAEFRETVRRDPDYVPAYLQGGRTLIRMGEDDDAKQMLRVGIEVARRVGNDHAAGEMQGFLESLG